MDVLREVPRHRIHRDNTAKKKPALNIATIALEFYQIYYMACVCNRYNARSDWLILAHYSPAGGWGGGGGGAIAVWKNKNYY